MDPNLPPWLNDLGRTLLTLLPGGVFTAWCLWAVNWRRLWPVLAAGGWVPMVLIAVMGAYVWSKVWPTDALVFGLFVVPNRLWQLGSAGILVGIALFCGWLQVRYGWGPPEIELEPPAHGHEVGHAHPPEHELEYGHSDVVHDEQPAPTQTNGHAAH
jgi:hypothetical protein